MLGRQHVGVRRLVRRLKRRRNPDLAKRLPFLRSSQRMNLQARKHLRIDQSRALDLKLNRMKSQRGKLWNGIL